VQGRFFYTFVFAPAAILNTTINPSCFSQPAISGDCTFALAIGFSKNSVPKDKDDFCSYYYPYGDTLPDEPKLGDMRGFLLIGANLHSHGHHLPGADVLWVSKPAAGVVSNCPTPSSFTTGRSGVLGNADQTLAYKPVPAHSIDQSETGWVVATRQVTSFRTCESIFPGCSPTSDYLSLFEVTTITGPNAPARLSFSPAQQVRLPCGYEYSAALFAPQPGSAPTLQTFDGLMQAVLAKDPNHGSKFALWTQHTVATSDRKRSMVQWYELDPAGKGLFQYGQVKDPKRFVYNGAISPDRSRGRFGENVAIGVNTSSASANDYVAIQVVTKLGSNAQSGLTMVKQSTEALGGLGGQRWGDYSAASPDPVNAFEAVLGVSGVTLTSTFTQGDQWGTLNWQVPFTTPILAPSAPAVSITGFTHLGDLTYGSGVAGGQLVHDSATHQMLLIAPSGVSISQAREGHVPGPAKVWDLKQDPSNWQPIPTQHPGPTSSNQLVFYNPKTCRVELLSVYDMQVSRAFTGTDWQSLPRTSAPPGRLNTSLAYDAKNANMLMFGGSRDQGGFPLGDTWTWDGKTWTEQHPAHSPPATVTSNTAYDPESAGVLLYDNVQQGTWLWNGKDWNQLRPLHSPPAKTLVQQLVTISPTGSASGHVLAVVYDISSRSQTLWLWDGKDWSAVGAPPQGEKNLQYHFAYDQDTQTLWSDQGVPSSDGLTLTSKFWTAKVNFTPRR
jgi:hypothetical protein